MTKTLRAWRAEQLLSTRRIATLSGTSNKTIVQIENGRQTPTFATIDKISRVLQVEPREITEFALALAERARASLDDAPDARTAARPATHVLCVSAVASFLTVTRRLLEVGRYGVTSMIGVTVTVEQIACVQPDLVIFDLGTDAPLMLDLMQRIRANAMITQLPIVVTGRDRRRLGEIIAVLADAARQGVTISPFDSDLRELVAAVESLTRESVAADTETEPAELMALVGNE